MTDQKKALHIDIPVELKEVKSVFRVASLSKAICRHLSFTFSLS
jgi:hypothetical protein